MGFDTNLIGFSDFSVVLEDLGRHAGYLRRQINEAEEREVKSWVAGCSTNPDRSLRCYTYVPVGTLESYRSKWRAELDQYERAISILEGKA